MPVVSRFYGIVIAMYYRDHHPPHFHAKYGDEEITVEIDSGLTTGSAPKRVRQMVEEWREQHRAELLENWERARESRPLSTIPPLE